MAGTLYFLHSGDEETESELLYIGASMNGAARLAQHEKDKAWWPEVTKVILVHYEKREQAFEAESRMLEAGNGGKYNIAGAQKTSIETLTQRLETRRLREEREASIYRLHAPCTNCGRSWHMVPKGTLVVDHTCEGCGCRSIQTAESEAI